MRLFVHGVLGLALVLATGGVASAKKCTDDAAVAAARTLANSECDCAGSSNHGKFVSCAAGVADELVQSNDLPKECKGEVVSCAARSTCGKPGAVTCCRIDRRGKVKCSIKSSASKCKAPNGGQACPGGATSCCDSCGAGSPEGSFTCESTTTTTSAPTTTSAAPTTTTAAPTTTTAAPTTTTAAPTTTTAAPTTTTSTSSSTTTTTPGSPSAAFVERRL